MIAPACGLYSRVIRDRAGAGGIGGQECVFAGAQLGAPGRSGEPLGDPVDAVWVSDRVRELLDSGRHSADTRRRVPDRSGPGDEFDIVLEDAGAEPGSTRPGCAPSASPTRRRGRAIARLAWLRRRPESRSCRARAGRRGVPADPPAASSRTNGTAYPLVGVSTEATCPGCAASTSSPEPPWFHTSQPCSAARFPAARIRIVEYGPRSKSHRRATPGRIRSSSRRSLRSSSTSTSTALSRAAPDIKPLQRPAGRTARTCPKARGRHRCAMRAAKAPHPMSTS